MYLFSIVSPLCHTVPRLFYAYPPVYTSAVQLRSVHESQAQQDATRIGLRPRKNSR